MLLYCLCLFPVCLYTLTGFYCPIGTGYDWVSCPLGTYGTTVSAKNASECADCPAGSYCNELNATASSGPCNERFYCASGSDNPEPSGSKRNFIF